MLKSPADVAKQVAFNAEFWTMLAAAYVVYRMKSWYRGGAEGSSSESELKDELVYRCIESS